MTVPLLGSNLPLVRRQNRSLVLRVLLHHGPISRSQIGEMTKLTTATIGNVVNELLESDLVVEVGAEPPGSGRPGRPRLLVDLNPRGLYVVGVHLGVRSIQTGVGDLRGRLLSRSTIPVGDDHSPGRILSLVCDQVRALLDRTPVPIGRVCGVGVGTVGLVNSATGEILQLPQFGWRGVPAGQQLSAQLQLPVVVDNSRRAMVMAEAWLGQGRGLDSIMLVHVATTVGGAVAVRGEVLPGSNYAAGQLGHLIVIEHGQPCACGKLGCLDTVASGAAIMAEAARAARERRSSLLLELAGGNSEKTSLDHVFAAAAQDDPAATAIVDRAARFLGVGVAHYISLLDPQVIVLAGVVPRLGGARYRSRVAAVANERSCRPNGDPVTLVPPTFGEDLELVGAFSLALRRLIYSEGLALANGRIGNNAEGT